MTKNRIKKYHATVPLKGTNLRDYISFQSQLLKNAIMLSIGFAELLFGLETLCCYIFSHGFELNIIFLSRPGLYL